MAININSNNQVIIDQLGVGVTWEANDGVTVQGGNYGEILSVETTDTGSLVVRTANGTLTFAVDSPDLEEANETFAPYELAETGFEEFDGFNWLEIAALVLQAENLRRNTARLIRQDARDTAFDQAMTAAQKLMKGALTNMIIGCVAGGVSIVGGVFSLKSSLGSMKNLKSTGQDLKMAKVDAKMAKTQTELSQTRADIKTLEAKPQPLSPQDQAKLNGLKTREQQLVTQREQQLAKLDSDISETQAKLDKTNEKFDQNNKDIATKKKDIELCEQTIDDPDSTPQDVARAKADKARLEKEVASLEKDQQHLADKAELLNDKLSRLEGIKLKSEQFDNDVDGAMLDQAKKWSEGADAEVQHHETKLHSLQMEAQRDVQIGGAWQSLAQSVSQILNAIGSFFETQGQADAKIHDAYASQAQFAQDDATQDMQSAAEAIRNFKEAWQKFLDTVKQAEDRLVQA